MIPGQGREVGDLVIVEAPNEDGIQFQMVKACVLCRLDAGKHIRERSQPGHGGKSVRPQGVHADIQPVHARFPQRGGQFRQQGTVGGEAQLLKARDGPQHAAQFHDAPAHQRLPAGEADLLHAAAYRRTGDLLQLFEGEDILMGLLGHSLGRHAVPAAVVAPIRHRQAQIVDLPPAAVAHTHPLPRYFF